MKKLKPLPIVTGYEKYKPEDILAVLVNHADSIQLMQWVTVVPLLFNVLMFAAVCFIK